MLSSPTDAVLNFEQLVLVATELPLSALRAVDQQLLLRTVIDPIRPPPPTVDSQPARHSPTSATMRKPAWLRGTATAGNRWRRGDDWRATGALTARFCVPRARVVLDRGHPKNQDLNALTLVAELRWLQRMRCSQLENEEPGERWHKEAADEGPAEDPCDIFRKHCLRLINPALSDGSRDCGAASSADAASQAQRAERAA